MIKPDIRALYYITHKNNIKSILEKGILSHASIEELNLNPSTIYNDDVIKIRKNKKLPNGESLASYSNFYFQPKNPMLYRVLHTYGKGKFANGVNDIVILELKKTILDIPDSYIATGNAATSYAEFLSVSEGIKKLEKTILDDQAWWTDITDGKTKFMAECLIKHSVDPEYISSIFCASDLVKEELKSFVTSNSKIEIVLDKIKFFLPNWKKKLTNKITLIQGDMFFSNAQTLTISVNTVGVMGKGLASRARYQFPDVFVEYQDLCKSKKLKMGKPSLIKRDKSLDEFLAYKPDTLENKNSYKWFLLFPTKSHWRENSDFEGIEKGLKWLVENYKQENILSIALPALGCGLGKLEWKKIGSLMCKYLNQMDIQSFIYLPLEREIPPEELTQEFLLRL